jgi:uncharacterized protein YoaH (UPF0181 family)
MRFCRIDQTVAMEVMTMNPSQQVAAVEVIGENVLIIFKSEQAALLTAKDLRELAEQKNAFLKIPDEDDAGDS